METQTPSLEMYIRNIFHYIRYNAEQTTVAYNITKEQGRLLEVIIDSIENNKKISRKYLQKQLFISGPSVTSLLNGLEKKGFIIRETCLKDGRANDITVTDKGRSVINEVKNLFKEQEKLLTQGMTLEEISTFHSLLERACCNIGISLNEVK